MSAFDFPGITNFLESWIDNPKLITMDNMGTNALVTSSSPRFNIYDNDFGWGRPIAVRSGPGNKSDGKITLPFARRSLQA
ncbi:hypothetical protein Patl1_28652 [Pistacia atlantica]|uniref:Uncharacterized protein n=1 Tax=Pistacia atlantica TaxID=434234 RepID=A0ACC1BEY0_9ROSI|nr:hypothetical protein Patl1_28652 [Pistacia atlantica]